MPEIEITYEMIDRGALGLVGEGNWATLDEDTRETWRAASLGCLTYALAAAREMEASDAR